MVKYRPHAVYVRTCFLQGLQAILTRLAGVPLVGEVDGIVDAEIRSRRDPLWWRYIILFLDHVNFRLSSGSVCVTRKLAAEVIRRGGNPRTTIHIHNGAETDVMTPGDSDDARRKLNLPREDTLVAFAGTFAPWAGLDALMAAAEVLAERRAAVRLALMGDGETREKVAEWSRTSAMRERVILLPRGSRQEVRILLSACDVVVLPFNDFGVLRFGLSSLKFWDAVSMGLPPLVPRRADLGDVLADLGIGAEYDHAGPEALADALEALVSQPRRTPEQRRQTYNKVREKYSWDAVAKQVAAFLETLTAGKQQACA
ncbi:MAG: glycosyltransferase, partial [Phycisphaerae bacterium]|nr:glycosyltransferase [Phycisphaerae bacterium]